MTMSKATQTRRFDHALRVLNDIPRGEFSMDMWGRKRRLKTKPICRTTACLAGHMSMDPYFQRAGLSSHWTEPALLHGTRELSLDSSTGRFRGDWVHAVAEVLGITRDDADALTDGGWTEVDGNMYGDNRRGVRARLKRLRKRYLGG